MFCLYFKIKTKLKTGQTDKTWSACTRLCLCCLLIVCPKSYCRVCPLDVGQTQVPQQDLTVQAPPLLRQQQLWDHFDRSLLCEGYGCWWGSVFKWKTLCDSEEKLLCNNLLEHCPLYPAIDYYHWPPRAIIPLLQGLAKVWAAVV